MKFTLTHQLPPAPGNPRNSEGAFLRCGEEILLAYSRYNQSSGDDHAPCDIALIRSADEGITWSEPVLIARAAEFGTRNIMSVSAVEQRDGRLGFYFLIKENDGRTTMGRTLSADGGKTWTAGRCRCDFPDGYYVVNNDRIVRLADGRLIAPAAWITAADNLAHRYTFVSTLLISADDGDSFFKADVDLASADTINAGFGLQEPGILERGGELYLWARTNYGCQYQSSSFDGGLTWSKPLPSEFTSPPSPMQIKNLGDFCAAVYNPIPMYNGRNSPGQIWGRTPLVLRISRDGGHTFGPLMVLEDEPDRGYSYPAVFLCRDGALLLAYCRGNMEDGCNLFRLGIARVEAY